MHEKRLKCQWVGWFSKKRALCQYLVHGHTKKAPNQLSVRRLNENVKYEQLSIPIMTKQLLADMLSAAKKNIPRQFVSGWPICFHSITWFSVFHVFFNILLLVKSTGHHNGHGKNKPAHDINQIKMVMFFDLH